MRYPAGLSEIICDVIEQYPTDRKAGINEAIRQWRSHDEYGNFVDMLINTAVKNCYYEKMHYKNTRMRHSQGAYGQPAKVLSGTSAVVDKVNQAVIFYHYTMGGKTLGDLYGRDLADIVRNETAKANGSLFRAKLADKLRRKVPVDKKVSQVLSNKQLGNMFKQTERELGFSDPEVAAG